LNGEDRLAEVLEEAHRRDIRAIGIWGPTLGEYDVLVIDYADRTPER
jgi:hypothetical protein